MLVFKLPEESEEFETAVKSGSYKAALEDISNEVFRPARKHGYNNPDIYNLLKALPEGTGEELIGLLEQEFSRILQDREINLF